MKVIIAGSREFFDYDSLSRYCDYILSDTEDLDIQIVSGGARGADKLGELYAEEKQHPVATFLADWDNHGKQAGYLRNVKMAEYADALIAFWDGKSKGTGHMIDIARKHNLKVRIYNTNTI